MTLILNSIGRIVANTETRTLTPANLNISIRLWNMIQNHPHKTAQWMSLLETTADEYDDSAPWIWHLPVPDDYHLCECCAC